MATASEIVPYLVRKGVVAKATSASTIQVEGVELHLPVNHRRSRAFDLSNWVIRQLKKVERVEPRESQVEVFDDQAQIAPQTPSEEPEAETAPEVEPEPQVEPEPTEKAPETVRELEQELSRLTHKQLDERLQQHGLALISNQNKAEKVARLLEVLQ